MAERRMLAKSIMETDVFSDMPTEAQMLYVRLIMSADDDGFISNPRAVMRAYGFSDDSMKLLIAKKFVLTFEKNDGFIYLIKHWRVHNYIRNDRYKASTFKELLRGVYYDENNAYSLNPGDGKKPCMPPIGIPHDIPTDNQVVDNLDTQVRLGKDRVSIELDKDIDNIDQINEGDYKGEQPAPEPAPAQQETEDDRIIYYKKNIERELARGRVGNPLIDFYTSLADKEGIYIKIYEDDSGGPFDNNPWRVHIERRSRPA